MSAGRAQFVEFALALAMIAASHWTPHAAIAQTVRATSTSAPEQFFSIRDGTTTSPRLGKEITLDLRGVPLQTALEEITRQAGLSLVVNPALLSPQHRITLRNINVTTHAALASALEHTNLDLLITANGEAVLVKRTAPAPQVQAGSIHGLVTDAETGAAIAGAEVMLEGTGRRTVTGEDGRYRLTEVTARTYTVFVRRIGYLPERRSEIVEDGQEVVVDIALRPTATTLDELIVTARKREERLQDVPASIAAASAETLDDLKIVSVTELDAIAPGLTFVTNPSRFGSGPSIALRGVSTQTQGSGVQNSVGIVVDGVVIERAKAGAFPDLADIERIEVLRGPQGTLFGKNASAGLISITTRNPTDGFSADAGLGYSTHNTLEMRASLSGPFVEERLLGRLSAYRKTRKGFVENIHDGSHWEDDDQNGIRGKLMFIPTVNDVLTLSGDFAEQKNDGGTNIIRAFTPATEPYVREQLDAIASDENDNINTHSLGHNRQRSRGLSLQWERSFGSHTLTTLLARRDYRQDFHAGTYVWRTPLDEGDQFGWTDQTQNSAEIRFSSRTGERLEYVIGLFALDNRIGIGLLDPGILIVDSDQRNTRNQISWVDTFGYAAFAEADINFTDQLTLTAGLRWTREDIDMTVTGYPTNPDYLRFGHPLGTTQDAASASNTSWRFGGQWRLDSDRMLYATAATGFKGPGFNVNTSALGDSQPVEPEISTSYEVGFKSQFLDRRLTFNITAFYTTFEDFQTQGGLILPGNPTAAIILLNAEELSTRGVEMEVAARASGGAEIGVNATYIDANFEKFANAPCYPGQAATAPGTCSGNVQDLSGARLPNTPEWNVNLFGKHDFTLPESAWRGVVSLDYSWRSDVQWNLTGSPDGIESAHGLLGASIGLRSPEDRFSVKLYSKNLTDQFHTSGIVVGREVTHFLPPDYRRFVGLELAYHH